MAEQKFDPQQHILNAIQETLITIEARYAVLYLSSPDNQQVSLELAFPSTEKGDQGFAQVALQKQEIIRKHAPDGDLLVYLPLVIYQSLALGVIGFKLPPQRHTPTEQLLLRLLADQIATNITNERLLLRHEVLDQKTAADHRILMKIYEAIPALELDQDLEIHLQHVAETYLQLGWLAVEATLLDPSNSKINLRLNDAQIRLPQIADQTWQKKLQEEGIELGNATLLSNAEGLDILLIRIPDPDGAIAAQIHLFQAANIMRLTAESIRPFMIFARHFGNAIQRSRLIQSLRRAAELLSEQVDELEFMRNADREISSRLDPDRIAQFTLDWAMRRTAADAGGIVIIDSLSKELSIKEVVGYPEEKLRNLQFNSDLQGVVGRCIRERSKQLVENVHQDPDYIEIIPKMATQLAIPLISYKRTVGAITLESRVAGRFDEYSIQFIERIASMTAIALDNAQLLQQAEQLADDMSIIHNAGRTISASLQWEETIESIAQGMALAVKGADALIYAYDAQSQQARLLSLYTPSADTFILPKVGSFLDVGKYPQIQQAIDSSQLLLVKPSSPNSHIKEWIQQLGYQHASLTPLTAQGEAVGLAILLKVNPHETFAASEIFVVESLATQAAAVLRQASLYSNMLELEKLKTEMMRMASHDLRAPIANTMGFLELLEQDIQVFLTDELENYLESIRRSLQSMENLVGDLLTLEKVENERQDSWSSQPLESILQDVMEQQHAAASLKKQSLSLKMEGEPYSVRGSSTQLRQVFTNLIGNAIKYTPHEGQVRVHTYRQDRRFYCQVQDTGYGIPTDRQDRIFQRFYRAKTPGTEHISGSGLGLSLVKSIIERHQGRINFSSIQGEGSTFTFWLPLEENIWD